MTAPDRIAMEITRLEAAHLATLVAQFAELVEGSSSEDPAVLRLVPDAYRDDDTSAEEFRALTERDLLGRRLADARVVLADLAGTAPPAVDDLHDPALLESRTIVLDPVHAQGWLRTLAAVRLVLAQRLGIVDTDAHADGDPRFGIYDWLGYRLDGLVRAMSPEG